MEITPDELFQALINPGAPPPAAWPHGALGAFLLFMFPIGGRDPLRRHHGARCRVYTPRDFCALRYLRCVRRNHDRAVRHVLPLAGPQGELDRPDRRAHHSCNGRSGIYRAGKRGPLGIALVSFTVSMTTGRAAAVAAGHGPVMGWALAILGDLGYFLVLMALTLWLSSNLGDERITVGVVLVGMWVVPMLIRKWRERNAPKPRRVRTPVTTTVSAVEVIEDDGPVAVRVAPPKRRGSRAARKRAKLAEGTAR